MTTKDLKLDEGSRQDFESLILAAAGRTEWLGVSAIGRVSLSSEALGPDRGTSRQALRNKIPAMKAGHHQEPIGKGLNQ